MRLVFSRHGESEANVQWVYWNQPGQYPLTPKGRQQAEALADALEGIHSATPFAARLAGLYCSPVLRAVQTAEIVGRRFRLTPQVADGLREYSVGILEGKKASPETEDLFWWVRKQWMEGDNHDARIEGGESYNDIAARFMPFIRELEARYRDTEASLLLISHGGTLGVMLPLLLSNVDMVFPIAHPMGYTNPIVAELRDGEWVCLRWGKEIL